MILAVGAYLPPHPVGLDSDNWYRVEIPDVDKDVHDGDTVNHVRVHLGLGVVLEDQGLRPNDYDAWEVSRIREQGNRNIHITDEEIIKGKTATLELRGLLRGRTLYVQPDPKHPREKYGRILGPWRVVDPDGTVVKVGEYAREHGWQRSEQFESDRP